MIAKCRLATASSLFLVSLGGLAVPGPAHAGHVACGQTITVSTVLDSNVGPCARGITIGADNITFDLNGFTITGNATTGEGPGILLPGRTGVTVKNGTVTQFDAGVAIEGGSANTVTFMQILNNRGSFSTDYGDGIALFDSDRNRLLNNRVRNNGPYSGIGLIVSDFNLIDGNQITDNNQSAGSTAGIRLENIAAQRRSSNNNTVTNNLVTNSATFGIQLFGGSANNHVAFNQVFGNRLRGIPLFAGSTNNTVEGNNLRSNGSEGIWVQGAAGIYGPASGNNILRNYSFGHTEFDLRDLNANCGTNQWHGNQGATGTPPCVFNP